MEKLIKLLNEYSEIRKYNNAGIVEWVEHTKWNLYWKDWENTWSYMVVISKEYGFIKWLVENNKIAIPSLIWRFDEYETVLCNLAISSTPIETLISYLK